MSAVPEPSPNPLRPPSTGNLMAGLAAWQDRARSLRLELEHLAPATRHMERVTMVGDRPS